MKYFLKSVLKRLIIYILITVSLMGFFLIYLLMTESGAKFLFTASIKHFSPNQSYVDHIKLANISGSFAKGLTLTNLVYLNPKHEIIIKHIEIELNLFKIFKTKQISVVIKNLSGTFNNHPITTYLNFDFVVKNFFYRNNIQIILNNPGFFKVGNNNLELAPPLPNQSSIKFTLTASQLEIFQDNFQGLLIIEGLIANDLKTFSAKVITDKLLFNGKNHLGKIFVKKNNQIELSVSKDSNEEIKVKLFVDLKDLTSIADFIPDLSRLKGTLKGQVEFYFNNFNDAPKISSNLSLENITAVLPEYGVKVKPLNVQFIANKEHKVFIKGKGIMRNGPGEFTLNGFFEPFSKKFNNLLEINTTELELVNTKEYRLIGTTSLKLNFLLAEKILKIVGNTCISEGFINLDQETSSKIIKSKDIVFTNIEAIGAFNEIDNLSIVPDFNLRIEPNTKLVGKGLNTRISGKLKIYTLEDKSTIVANGRISIKQGTYTISGQEFNIEKGRIIYLPKTFIGNPTLDIKITPSERRNTNFSKEKYLYVEGTLENPIIKDSGLIDEHQAILQLLNFSNDKFTSIVKKKWHLQEFGIQDKEEEYKQFSNKSSEESLLGNKNFVIGKKFKNKMHLQYLKTLNSTNNTLRLKYNLNDNWQIGVESNTLDGNGADLRFSIEK